MIDSDSFTTVSQPREGLYKEKGSKFISYIYPISTEKEVKPLLDFLRKQHPKARHLCYAFRFGPDPELSSYSDDGEPSGTAGLPILNQLRSHHLQNTLIVVVRYFGGVLLGASGLGQAYKLSAVNAIQGASFIVKFRYAYFTLNHSYPVDKKIKSWISSLEGLIISQQFSGDIQSKIAVPVSMGKSFIQSLQEKVTEQQWPGIIKAEWLYDDPF